MVRVLASLSAVMFICACPTITRDLVIVFPEDEEAALSRAYQPPPSVTVEVGGTRDLMSLIVETSDEAGKTEHESVSRISAEWASSDTAIATVPEEGSTVRVTGVQPGIVTVTSRYFEPASLFDDTIEVEVVAELPPPPDVDVTCGLQGSAVRGQTATVRCTLINESDVEVTVDVEVTPVSPDVTVTTTPAPVTLTPNESTTVDIELEVAAGAADAQEVSVTVSVNGVALEPVEVPFTAQDDVPLTGSCAEATEIVAGTPVQGDNSSSNDFAQSTCHVGAPGGDVAFFFTASVFGNATLRVDGLNQGISVRRTCDDAATEIGCITPAFIEQNTAFAPVELGEQYFVLVGAAGAGGPFTLTLTEDGHTCGNGVRDEDEVCEGDDVGDLTCADFGFVGGGEVTCTDNCEPVVAGCTN